MVTAGRLLVNFALRFTAPFSGRPGRVPMKKLNIRYIERKFDYFVSVEKVFRRVEAGLDKTRFSAAFSQLRYPNGLVGVVRNLLTFRPDRNADVHHVTGHCHYIALVLPPEKTVLTIHDLGFLHTRSGLRRWVLKKLFLDLPLARLKYVTAISDATAREIEANAPRRRADVRVIPNPADDFLRTDERKEFNDSRPNILQIGASPNKNLDNLIEALEGLPCKLTVVGKVGREVLDLLEGKRIDFEIKSSIDDEAMRDEYMMADIVAFCSTYEGFGLPIIEAQAMRRPVLTSDLSPMREVAGAGGARLVDPFSHESIREGIVDLIHNPGLRDSLVENGLKNLERFDKRTVARQYASLYEEIVSRRDSDSETH